MNEPWRDNFWRNVLWPNRPGDVDHHDPFEGEPLWRRWLVWDVRWQVWGFAILLLIGVCFIVADLIERAF